MNSQKEGEEEEMAGVADTNISNVLFKTLDILGYRKERISLRSKIPDELCKEFCKSPLRIIPAGSSAEGVSLSQSDRDFMFVYEDVVCLDHAGDSEGINVLKTERAFAPPGYTRLMSPDRLQLTTTTSVFLHLSQSSPSLEKNCPYISSSKFKELFIGCNRFQNLMTFGKDDLTVSGPAISYHTGRGLLASDFDIVTAFYYYSPSDLYIWKNRARYSNWPSANTIKDVSEFEGFVVPIGDKLSEDQSLEWRICYTTAEKKLVSDLDDILLKLYVLLKRFAKVVLKPVCNAITSYVVKNIVFWIAEMTSTRKLTSNNLIFLMQKSLFFLRYCLANNHIPNYMIPTRNLLRGTMSCQGKRGLLMVLSECHSEGSRILLRMPTLCDHINTIWTNPQPIIKHVAWRDRVEKICTELLKSGHVNAFDIDTFANSDVMDMLINIGVSTNDLLFAHL